LFCIIDIVIAYETKPISQAVNPILGEFMSKNAGFYLILIILTIAAAVCACVSANAKYSMETKLPAYMC